MKADVEVDAYPGRAVRRARSRTWRRCSIRRRARRKSKSRSRTRTFRLKPGHVREGQLHRRAQGRTSLVVPANAVVDARRQEGRLRAAAKGDVAKFQPVDARHVGPRPGRSHLGRVGRRCASSRPARRRCARATGSCCLGQGQRGRRQRRAADEAARTAEGGGRGGGRAATDKAPAAGAAARRALASSDRVTVCRIDVVEEREMSIPRFAIQRPVMMMMISCDHHPARWHLADPTAGRSAAGHLAADDQRARELHRRRSARDGRARHAAARAAAQRRRRASSR